MLIANVTQLCLWLDIPLLFVVFWCMSIVIFRVLQFRLLLFSPFVLLFTFSWSAAKLGLDAWWGLCCFDINSTYLKLNTTFLLPSEGYWRGLFNLSEKTGNNCLWRRTTQEVRYEAKGKPQSFKLNPKLKTKGQMTSSAVRLRGPPEGRRASLKGPQGWGPGDITV